MDLFEFDDDYVRRLKTGDRVTEEHFHAYFRERLRSKLNRRLPTADMFEDIIQETFGRVFASLDKIRDGRSLGAYVNRVADNVMKESMRKYYRSVPLEDTHETIDGGVDLYERMATAEVCARVRRVLARMTPPRDADILKALFFNEETKDEICGRLGIDREYLRVLLHRAKERFRAEFARKSIPPYPPVTFLGYSSLWV